MNFITRFCLPVAVLALGVQGVAAETFTVGGLEYQTLTESTVKVNKYLEGTDVVIPSTVKDSNNKEYTVVELGNTSFWQTPNLNSVKVPSTVKRIGRNCFYKSGITSIELAEGLEILGYSAFSTCANLQSIKLPSTLTNIGEFWDVGGVTGHTFVYCTSLKEFEVPEKITVIPEQLLRGCTALEKVTFKGNVTEFEDRVFEECSGLKSFTFPEGTTKIGESLFSMSGLESIVVPGTIKIIPFSAFLRNHKMTSFEIEEGVVELGKQGFADCGPLKEIRVPNSVEWIRSDCFQGNELVEKIYLGSGVRRLGHCSLAVWGPDEETNTPQWTLTDVYIDSPVPPVHEQNDDHIHVLDDDFFFGAENFTPELRDYFYSTVKLHVPEDAVEAYRAATVWCNFKNINDHQYGGVSDITGENAFSIANGIVSSSAPIEIFNLGGMKVGATEAGEYDLNQLGAGVYVVRSAGKVIKTVVK